MPSENRGIAKLLNGLIATPNDGNFISRDLTGSSNFVLWKIPGGPVLLRNIHMAQSSANSVAKGAIIKIPPSGSSSTTPVYILFQYNPATVHRSLQPSVVGSEPGGHTGSVVFTGAPVETFTLTIEIDERDQLSLKPAQVAVGQFGISPVLYALEWMQYPELSDQQSSLAQLEKGATGVIPYKAPQVLLMLGPERVVPVSISSIQVVEEDFDANLNPVRVSVTLEARASSCSDVAQTAPEFQTFVTYQQVKESLGKIDGAP